VIAPPVIIAVAHFVAEVDQHLVEWDGRIVRVRGWVNTCGPGRATGPAVSPTKQCAGRGDLPISISPRLFRTIKGKVAVLKVRIDASCRKHRCFDRYSLLQVQRVEAVSPTFGVRSN
jgi:hypothetical protein